MRELVIVSWNVHEGGGDVAGLVASLRRGDLTGGRAVEEFVLLLQETFRSGKTMPRISHDAPVPERIAPPAPSGPRIGIVMLATDLGLSYAYVPSMRNGPGDEDRGNAIVSTLPLRDVTAIELPFERQRRVAVAGTLGGVKEIPVFRVVSAHLESRAGVRRGGPLAARRRQARALVDALAAAGNEPAVVAGDFNTWLGAAEPAYRALTAAFSDVLPDIGTTWVGPMHLHASLDRVFVRLPAAARIRAQRLTQRFGSDHFPVLLQISF